MPYPSGLLEASSRVSPVHSPSVSPTGLSTSPPSCLNPLSPGPWPESPGCLFQPPPPFPTPPAPGQHSLLSWLLHSDLRILLMTPLPPSIENPKAEHSGVTQALCDRPISPALLLTQLQLRWLFLTSSVVSGSPLEASASTVASAWITHLSILTQLTPFILRSHWDCHLLREAYLDSSQAPSPPSTWASTVPCVPFSELYLSF